MKLPGLFAGYIYRFKSKDFTKQLSHPVYWVYLTSQQTIQLISFFTLHNFFYNIYFCEHIKGFYNTIKSPYLLGC